MGAFRAIFIALSFSLLLQSNIGSFQNYRTQSCLGGNYTANSIFQANLNVLLSSLTDDTIPSNKIFYNKSVGNDSDKVYGVLQCRGDSTSADCKKLAVTATDAIKNQCPFKKEAIIFYDEGWLHYSNWSLSTLQLEPTETFRYMLNISDTSLYMPAAMKLMERLQSEAVSVSPNLYAVGNASYSSTEKVYGLVQCLQNLPRSDCNRCLTKALSEIPVCCYNTMDGRVFMPSCNTMFASYEFFLTRDEEASPDAGPFVTPSPDTNTTWGQDKKSSRNVVIIVVPVLIITLLLPIIGVFLYQHRKKRFKMVKDEGVLNPTQSLQLDFSTVVAATGNFCDDNKLGEGGFGGVYKGVLPDEREIAVKRLSQNSIQGGEEFKNEVVLLSKLEHRNLVKLLGFCLEGDERLLIYEYLPNGSLDHYLFDPAKATCLDWDRRYQIIRGIARGLLYLHEDSQYMIIHRDIKASNILLDGKMNPKISDFGMARLFMLDKTQGSTNRIVGTLGYMAPEYAYHGHFSVRSDVFSFGVLVLEIVSGRKNNRYYESQVDEYLLSSAWKHLSEGTSLELLEPSLGNSYSRSEVVRCIHVGLLCVQEDVAKRPTMASVVVMLQRNTATLPLPSSPGFFLSSTTGADMTFEQQVINKTLVDQSTSSTTNPSINEVSITELCPR